jgi:lysophospholipase L1-like esterase
VAQTRFREHRETAERAFFDHHWKLPPDSAAWQTEVGFCLAHIRRTVWLCRDRGIRLFLTTYPHRQHFKADPGGRLWHREFERRLEALASEEGVPFFSAFDGIRAAVERGEPIYWDTDMHFTPVGQRLWSGLVADFYVSAAFLASSPD